MTDTPPGLAGSLQPPSEEELSARLKASARRVAKAELLNRYDVSAFIRRTARVQDVTVDRVIAEGLGGVHGPELQAAVEEEYAKALAAARDVTAVVSVEELEKLLRTQAVLKAELAELTELSREAQLVGVDGLVAKQRMDATWDRIRARIRKRRETDLAHLDHEQALARLDAEADPAHVRDRREHAQGMADLAKAREQGHAATAESRIRTAKRAADTLEAEARRAYPKDKAPQAVSKFLTTDEGHAAYDRYLRAAKPGLS